MPLENINNAYFSEACPIQPGQAAAGYLERLLLSAGAFSDVFNFTTLGMTSFTAYQSWWNEMLDTAFDRFGSSFDVHFDGNALDGNSVQAIVEAIGDWAHGNPSTGTLYIGGGTNAGSPVDFTHLTDWGWTCNHN